MQSWVSQIYFFKNWQTQDWRPGQFSAVPPGLDVMLNSTQHCVLGYSQPSLRDSILNQHVLTRY
jgi:hypothetical protein